VARYASNAVSITFDIDMAKLESHPEMTKFLARFGAVCLKEAQGITQERIHGGTGVYERSFKVQLVPGSPPELRFGNTAKHAIYLEEGTEAHRVAPAPPGRRSFTNPGRPGAIRFFSSPGGGEGSAVFSRGHVVSGIDAKHIVRDAVSEAGRKLGPQQLSL